MKLEKYLWKHPLESNALESLEKLRAGESAPPVQPDDASQPGEPEGQTGTFPSSVPLSKTQQCFTERFVLISQSFSYILTSPIEFTWQINP